MVNPGSRYREIVPEWMRDARALSGHHPMLGTPVRDEEACRVAAGIGKPKARPNYDYDDLQNALMERELKKLDAKLGIDDEDQT